MNPIPVSTPAIDLSGKVALVTGASRGIGESIALCFAKHGASVVLASRKIEGLQEVQKKIEAAGGKAAAVACHAGKEEQVRGLVESITAEQGKVDILVNNAATNPYFGALLDAPWPAWDKTFEVNLKGYFTFTREVCRQLQAREAGGSIINIASVAAFQAAVMQGIYGMTKAAVVSMTTTLAVELGGTGIRINSIAPGLVVTKFAGALVENQELVDSISKSAPARRIGRPDDIAGLALFLASDAANFITGQTITADGGWTLGAMM